jgi:hypothetical protein
MKRSLALLALLCSPAALAPAGCRRDATASGAKEMLSAFTKPGADHAALFADLRPKAEDYEAVFVGDAVEKAKAAMDPLWDGGKGLDPTSEQTQIDVAGATPDQLAKHEGTALGCPGGYKSIADKLNPKIIVYCFRFVKPGDRGGLAGDALVYVNGHWAYFPKPFRYLNPAAPAPSAGPATPPAPDATSAPEASGAPAAPAAPGLGTGNPGNIAQ